MTKILAFILGLLLISVILFIGHQFVHAWKFVAVGDIECKSAVKVANAITKYSNPVVTLLLGDLGYGKTSKCIKDAFPNSLATVGNHDKEKDVLKLWGLKKPIYSKTINDVTFLSLNSDTKVSKNLKSVKSLIADAKTPWIVPFSHYPCVTNPSAHHGEWKNCKKDLVPIFVQSDKVKLYLNGHNHGYQQCFNQDISFITSGAGGRDFYPWGSKMDDGCKNNISGIQGWLEVDVQENGMVGQFIDINGGINEDTAFQILK